MEIFSALSSSSSMTEFSKYVDLAFKEIKEKEGRSKQMFHGHLCRCICELNVSNWKWFSLHDGPQSILLYALGSRTALEIIGANLSTSSSLGAEWLEKEIIDMMITRDEFVTVLWEQCVPPINSSDACLTPQQNLLLKTLTRLPDLLSSKRGNQLNPSLYPSVYFKNLANVIHCCLKRVVDSIRNSRDVSVIFLAAVVAKSSLIGHKDSFWDTLCPFLEVETKNDLLWQRIIQQLIKRVPDQYLESVLDGIMKFITPSLLALSPLYRLIGNLPLESSHAKFLLTHKYILGSPVAKPHALIGYFNCSEKLKPLLCEILQISLPLWCDGSVLRHMSLQHHYRFSGIITLATTCYDCEMSNKKVNTELERLAMKGVQVHLENPIEIIRTRGMILGEHLMLKLHPLSDVNLQFTYDKDLEDVIWLKSLMKPVIEQEKHLKSCSKKEQTSKEHEAKLKQEPTESSPLITVEYGTGSVLVDTCSDNDSDDNDLDAYDMSNDPGIDQSKSPRYLRTCMQDLISKDSKKNDIAIRSIKSLLLKCNVSDLLEVCLDVAKILIHCDVLEDTEHLRIDSVIVLTTKCPSKVDMVLSCIALGCNNNSTDPRCYYLQWHRLPSNQEALEQLKRVLKIPNDILVAPYLCEQVYSPHYNLKQRMEILEILSQSAVNLSSVNKIETDIKELTPRHLKPWQQLVEDRIKAKTRVITKSTPKPFLPVENKFVEVAGQFFFPLMVNFDKKLHIGSLDLQGKDSFVLGQVLRTLGTIIHCAAHSPTLLSMSVTLLDFCWTLKHHSDVSIRIGVLYCLCCILSTSSIFIPDLIEKGINEMLLWAKEVVSDDASGECRQLAKLALSLFQDSTNQLK